MDKQSIAAFVLIGIILTIWMYFNAPSPVQPQQVPQKDSVKIENKISENSKQSNVQTAINKTSDKDSLFSNNNSAEESIITVETDLIRAEFTNKGARLKKYFLKHFKTWYHDDFPDGPYYKNEVQLINQENGGELNAVFVTKQGKLVKTAELIFNTRSDNYEYKITGTDSLVITYEFVTADSNIIRRNFVLYGNNYRTKIENEFVNMNTEMSGFNYDFQWEKGINFVEKNSVDEASYSNASAFSGGEQLIINSSSEDEKEKKEFNGQVDWLGMKTKYFGIIISPENEMTEGGVFIEGETKNKGTLGPREYYKVGYRIPIQNKSIQKDVFYLYIGPLDYDILKAYNENYEAIYDFGNFLGMSFIIRPISEYFLLPLFKFLHNFIPNYGFVIILFSLIIKVLLYPLTRKSMQSMKKMQLLQPKIAELKEKFKDDQQKISVETMNLYSKYGINPAGGCLPMLLQMPILVALWSLFNLAIELRNQPFIWWIDNLAAPDIILRLPTGIPLISHISGLAVLMGITMFIQQKMTMKDPTQKALVYMMPIMMTIMFMSLPSGVNLYYFMFNLFSIIQQYYVNHSKNDVELVPVDKPKKNGFMQRMMDAAAEQQKAQQQIKKKK